MLSAVALLVAPAAARADPCPGASVASQCSLAGEFGNTGEAIMRQPQAVDLLPNGNLLVGDRWGYRVQVYDSAHAPAGSFGEYGEGPGEFQAVGGIAHDSAGNIYVVDIQGNRVEKFDSGGAFLTEWGGKGSDGHGPASFDIEFKGGIAVSGSRVYVSDTFNHRIAEYGTDGHWIGQIGVTGTPGSDLSHLRYPQGLTVDGSGNLYVADDQNNRVEKFNATSGAYLATIGSSTELDNPYDVGVDGAGNLYVADNLGHEIDKYAADGTHVKTWGGKGDAPGFLQTPRALVVDSAGNSFVADTNNGRMQEFDSEGNPLAAWGLNGRTGGRLTGPEGLDLAAGRLAVADALEYWVQELDPLSGAPITKFGGHGGGPGQLELPGDVALDPSGAPRVADTGNDRLQLFDAGNGYSGEVDGLSVPAGVALDTAGNVWAADTGHDRVLEHSSAGALLRVLTGLSAPGDVAVSPSGDLFVADTGSNRVVRFNSAAAPTGAWPATAPTGIDTDAAGHVFVADPRNALVHVYDSDGHELLRFGARGHGPGEFWTGGPHGVTASADGGTVFASDSYGNRVERFAVALPPPPPPPVPQAAAVKRGRVKLTVPRQRLGSVLKRGLRVRASCPSTCTLSATLKRGRSTVARTRARLRANRTTTLVLRLTRTARRSLAHAHSVTLRLSTSVNPTSIATASRTLKLKR
ncbi:MAG: NHL repeat-containing protein [Thermoleophilaceae bacterium]